MKRNREGSRISLGSGREVDLIRSFLGPDEVLPHGVKVGPGDDCAVIGEDGIVVSCDLFLEGVHFRREWASFEEIGYRAAAAALSDLAAMAAAPLGVLVAMGLPGEEAEVVGGRIQAGVRGACEPYEAAVLGGDLSSAPDSVVLDLVAIGRAESPVLRSGSEAGDEIWVTGELGGSGGAVFVWEGGGEPPPGLREAFVRPTPRIRETRRLAGAVDVRAMIDVSDGLIGDAGHLAAASGVRMVLEGYRIPVHPQLHEVMGSSEEALRMALTGGEDYEVCFTSAPGSVDEEIRRSIHDEFGVTVTKIGWVEEGEGVYLTPKEGISPQPASESGFDHFRVRRS
jgi:thiamine-monophosphate kinase